MIFRIPNIEIKYADEIFTSNNLTESVSNILGDEYIRRVLYFNNEQIMQRWETDQSTEMAETNPFIGLVFNVPSATNLLKASCNAMQAPVIDAVRVPPSA